MAPPEIERPAVSEYDELSHWTALAHEYWQKSTPVTRVQSEVIKTKIWDVLQNEAFKFRSLLALENLQVLENYLWPGYNEDSTNYHVLTIVLIAVVKNRENLPVWDVFSNDAARFSSLFRRILSMSLDKSLTLAVRTHLLSFLISAFQSLDNGLIRKECAPLVSISLWHNLSSEGVRERKFERNENGQLRKAWRAVSKRYEKAEQNVQSKLRFERAWLYSMTLDFISRLFDEDNGNVVYCERFLEFLTDLESQMPTRRFVNTLLQDLNILALIRVSPQFNNESNGILRDLFVLFRHFVNFPIDDNTGTQYTRIQANEKHNTTLARLQKTALKHFKSKLTVLALSNYGAIDQRAELESLLAPLTNSELKDLCTHLSYRTSYPDTMVEISRELLMETLLSSHERTKSFQETVKDLNVLPTEKALYEPSLLRNEVYDGSRSLAIPKLNLQYLTVGDFLWRSFILYRCESFFEIRKHAEDTIKRLQPTHSIRDGGTQFNGFSRMAIPISKPAILDSAPPKVGQDYPAYVKAEIALDVSRLADFVRQEWDSLRPDDVVYLLAVHPTTNSRKLTNGDSTASTMERSSLRFLRTAEVVQVLDENNRAIRENPSGGANGYGRKPRLRRLIVNLDAPRYVLDTASKEKGGPNVYESINVIIRRRGRENNFKKILESIRHLALSDVPLSNWLQEVFLGYGDPSSATFSRLNNRVKALDFRDTFLDWEHLLESLPGKSVESKEQGSNLTPPFVLETLVDRSVAPTETKPSKKRRRDEAEPTNSASAVVKVSTYSPPNHGPYPQDIPKRNQVRFTPVQVKAIESGTQPGLTVIVGPPGTGKTDVATQIINNIYHDFPEQRTLLIAHSNQALNQLFQKIMNLDIDERHLLRLGHGEEDLDTEASYSKHGRVESFLDNRAYYLAEVDRLATTLAAPGAHGNSCETAGYFNSVYVGPTWMKFWEAANAQESNTADVVSLFPFDYYFQNAPQPLFPPNATKEQVFDIAQGCQRHIDRIFSELEDIRPFEILRNQRDKTNYLMIKEARIIAMTSTHAAMRRQEIADLGFHYDNVIMEEAAQITEIENFIPLALQNPKDGGMPLQRVVLCGDHLQNSPIVQNLAFRQFAKLEQSLFLRLVRLGVPTINLDRQGRARPSIAELYKWRYPKLDNLPTVLRDPEFLRANAGFKYDYQFIDVDDYKGTGESQPSPHFFQNLGEAEYAVAIYQYMRLLGYPASKVSILATYAGQRALIRDVLGHRCAKNRLFGLPKIVTTVDKYQGEQNDYVILSLTRTSRIGYLRDIRRLTVALSRARLGLYILGRHTVFETCQELRQAFDQLFQRPTKLMLTTGEMFPTNRPVGGDVDATEMVGVEHLGQYVYEMTQAKIEALKRGEERLNEEAAAGDAVDMEDEGVGLAEEEATAIPDEEDMDEIY